ncbi:DNA polymerase III subunit gamma/tau [uncultured Turicimonas sp.]|uniref:DNA polymerase III subunit gamma/tau n=3 Tax=Sutterellaceae TaxID=995019 RepID=UPI0028050A6A|nr:DNA polymerase III subunit gamma/tau [uncultured Turicimonas sp.]
MAYQVLARKWRPHDFSTLIGQDHVVRALTHALTENRLHHAYLFTGTRGVGKTTISRILAKCLNCVGEDGKGGITAHPCGVCEACRAIDEDRFVDYIEMDAASTRGIDDMVSLLERAKYAPTNARFKVYMIDEVHQLTTQAFNAMLKTLEEPPEYVKFILATTDPQKVPVTVLSRCLQFNLKSLSPMLISGHMEELLKKEGFPYELPALRMLATGARGSMRDGLSLLDQAIAFSAGNLTLENVREMLGTIDSTTLIRLLGALANRDPVQVMQVADEIGARSLSYTQALKDMALLFHRISMVQMLPASLNPEEPDSDAVKSLAQAFAPDEVQLYYQIAIHARNEISLAPDEYSGFTMALMRMMAFAPAETKNSKKPVVAPMKGLEAPAPRSPEAPVSTAPAAAAPKPEAQVASVSPVPPKPTSVMSVPVASKDPGDIPPWEESPVLTGSKKKLIEDNSPASAPTPSEEKSAVSARGSSPQLQESPKELLPQDDQDDVPWSYDDYVSEGGAGESGEDEYIPQKRTIVQERDEFEGVPVQMNPWLEAAKKIKLIESSQPLVDLSELESFDGSNMVLTTTLEALTHEEHVSALQKELQKHFGPQLQLKVKFVSKGKGQTLKRLRKQELIEEKIEKLDRISKTKLVKEILNTFGSTISIDNVTLYDKNDTPRVI